ncbi:MAG TPA: hypothetical protein VER03_15265 [Bryobacteraceae bacterium]|nr:hypothetical protein [Bryobacteraceae bacterium]
MKLALFLAITTLALSDPMFAQKNWRDAGEYDLFNRISKEGADSAQQLALLRDWERLYPETEFKRERLMSFAVAHKSAGNLRESFNRATELFNSDSNDTNAIHLMLLVGPKLSDPTQTEIATVVAAANKILEPKPAPVPRASLMPTAEELAPVTSKDPEAQPVSTLLREMRRNAKPIQDPALARRQAAEAALAWANSRQR